jgi:glycine cleavage system T protein
MKQTALFESHKESKAKFVNFAGFELPILYQDSGIIKEHLSVRESCGIFDVSHMGQALITGAKSEELLSYITPTNFINTEIGKAKYTVLLNENASIIDDLIFYKLANDKFLVIFNAARKDVDINWISKKSEDFNCVFTFLENQQLIALQGPKSEEVIKNVLDINLTGVSFMSVREINYNGETLYISRSGYTGEDGFEISASSKNIKPIWNDILKQGVKPIGLGARDSLRMEMGFPLYGSDLSEQINIGNSNLKWIISSNDNFIGKNQIDNDPKTKRLAIKLDDKGILREKMDLYAADQKTKIGSTTSGCFAPSLNYSIGQGYINTEFAQIGSDIYVDIRGKLKKATIVGLNFFKKEISAKT